MVEKTIVKSKCIGDSVVERLATFNHVRFVTAPAIGRLNDQLHVQPSSALERCRLSHELLFSFDECFLPRSLH